MCIVREIAYAEKRAPILMVIALVLLVSGAALFAEEGRVPLSVSCMETRVFSGGVPNESGMNPSSLAGGKAGYVFTFLAAGTNIVELNSLVVTKLQLSDGTDISKNKGLFWRTPSYRFGAFSQKTDDAKYVKFDINVLPDKFVATEIPEFEGTIVVVTAEGAEVETLTLKTDDTQPHTVGGYVVNLTEGRNVTIQKASNAIAKVELVVGDKSMQSNGQSSDRRSTTFSFHLESSSPEVTLKLTLWKGMKEQTVAIGNQEVIQ